MIIRRLRRGFASINGERGKGIQAGDIIFRNPHRAQPSLTLTLPQRTSLSFTRAGVPYFVAKRLPPRYCDTVVVKDASEQGNLEEIIELDDPFGRFSSFIAERRTQRRGDPSARNISSLSLDFIRNHLGAEWRWLRLTIAELTTDPEIVKFLAQDEDPNVKKAALNNPFAPPEVRALCEFCEDSSIFSSRPPNIIDDNQRAGIRANLRGFIPGHHDLAILKGHVHNLKDLQVEHLYDLFEVVFQRVKRIKIVSDHQVRDGNLCDGLIWGCNYGVKTKVGSFPFNASQQGFHLQFGIRQKGSFDPALQIAETCRFWEDRGVDYMGGYLTALRENRSLRQADQGRKISLIIWEDTNVALVAPRAQRVIDEMQIIVKRRTCGHLLETTPQERQSIGKAMFLAIKILEQWGDQTFNMVEFSKSFSDQRSGQRIIYNLMPRRAALCFSELLGRWIVDSFAEETAERAREVLQRNCHFGIDSPSPSDPSQPPLIDPPLAYAWFPRATSRYLAVRSHLPILPRKSPAPTSQVRKNNFEFEFEPSRCVIDGGRDFIPKYDLDLQGLPYKIVECSSCGLTLVNPQPTLASLRQLYEAAYFQSPDASLVGYANYSKEEANRLKVAQQNLWLLHKLLGLPRQNVKVLDLGCAFGYFLQAAKLFGWEPAGLDISNFAAEVGSRRYGLPIRVGTVEETDYEASSFDIITMWDYLEHVKDPSQTILKASRWLKKGGVVVVRFPDISSFIGRLEGARFSQFKLDHLFFFTPATLTHLLELFGLRILGRFSDAQFFTVPEIFWFAGFERTAQFLEKLGVSRREAVSTFFATQTLGNFISLLGMSDHSILIAQKV